MAIRLPPSAKRNKSGRSLRPKKPAPSTEQAPSVFLKDLIDIQATRLLVIHDAWSGYSEDSPLAMEYELLRTKSGGFAGTVRKFKRGQLVESKNVEWPCGTALLILHDLAWAEVVRGPYTPFIDHTDDFPSISIAVHVGPEGRGGLALLYSSSQGEGHAPWSLSLRGESYTSPGDDIGRALESIPECHVRDGNPPDEATLAAHARRLVDLMDAQYRETRKPGEVMSRKEALDWGGEELGPLIYRLANSEGGDAKSRDDQKKKR
jgi:hypothetical protein